MDHITLTGGLSYIFIFFMGITMTVILAAGTFWVFQVFIIEILLRGILTCCKVYKYFGEFIIYRRYIMMWMKKQEKEKLDFINDHLNDD